MYKNKKNGLVGILVMIGILIILVIATGVGALLFGVKVKGTKKGRGKRQ